MGTPISCVVSRARGSPHLYFTGYKMKVLRLTENEIGKLRNLAMMYGSPHDLVLQSAKNKLVYAKEDEVHAVFVGEYSDRQLIAIFSNLNEAERYSSLVSDYEDMETVTVDECVGHVSKKYWKVFYTFVDDTKGVREGTSVVSPSLEYVIESVQCANKSLLGDPYRSKYSHGYVSLISYISEEHAIELADEIRYRLPLMETIANWWADKFDGIASHNFTSVLMRHYAQAFRNAPDKFVIGIDRKPCRFLRGVLDDIGVVDNTDSNFPQNVKMIIESDKISVSDVYGEGFKDIYP